MGARSTSPAQVYSPSVTPGSGVVAYTAKTVHPVMDGAALIGVMESAREARRCARWPEVIALLDDIQGDFRDHAADSERITRPQAQARADQLLALIAALNI